MTDTIPEPIEPAQPDVRVDNAAAIGAEPEKLYSTESVAELFDVKIPTVREWIRTGTIKAVRVGRLWRIPRSEVIRLGNSKYSS